MRNRYTLLFLWILMFSTALLLGCNAQTAAEPTPPSAPTAVATEMEQDAGQVQDTSAAPTPTLWPTLDLAQRPSLGPAEGHGPGPHGPGTQHACQGGAGADSHQPGCGGPGGPDQRPLWQRFHQLPVPEAYANLTNPLPADPDSLARGAELYQNHCALCHGPEGMGDGPAAENLSPPATPLAITVRHLSDGYLFWRIAEGGSQWGTAMPAYGSILTDEDIWHLINFLRSLQGQGEP